MYSVMSPSCLARHRAVLDEISNSPLRLCLINAIFPLLVIIRTYVMRYRAERFLGISSDKNEKG